MQSGYPYRLISHRAGALSLRLGLGPGLRPAGAMQQLQRLFDEHSFWATGRSRQSLRAMLKNSDAAVSAWRGTALVGFGRASSDGRFRAVLWDVVVSSDMQGQGLGKQLVSALVAHPQLAAVERTYLMTSNCSGFYEKLGFCSVSSQKLMLKEGQNQSG